MLELKGTITKFILNSRLDSIRKWRKQNKKISEFEGY